MRRQSLLLLAPEKVAWVGDDLHDPGSGEVLIETTAGAVSIGTELPEFRGIARRSQPPRYPRMTGYKSVGVVAAAGTAVKHPRIGERVLSFYGHRTHALVPDDANDRFALLAILARDAAKGMRKVLPWIGDTTLVLGAGTMGLLTVRTLHALGARQIDVFEPVTARRALALQLGARRALTPNAPEVRSVASRLPRLEGGVNTAHEWYGVGFECSGRAEAFELLQRCMRRDGRICVLSEAIWRH